MTLVALFLFARFYYPLSRWDLETVQEDLKSKKVHLSTDINQNALPVPVQGSTYSVLSKAKRAFSQGINQYLQPSSPGLKIIFFALTISYITTFIFCLLIMRIEGFHLEWSNWGQFTHWIRCAFLHSRDGFSGAVIACIMTWLARPMFKTKTRLFLFVILFGIIMSMLAPSLHLIPGIVKIVSQRPESKIMLWCLQDMWCSYSRPGLIAGITFYLSLILLAYKQVRLKDSG